MMTALASVILAQALAASGTGPVHLAQPQQTVLFVCEHGSAKSVVAAAHFNRLAEERRLPFRAISRGTDPDPLMAPPAVRGLREDGLEPVDAIPARLSQSDLDGAQRVVTFCDLPATYQPRMPVERWEVPPVSIEYAASRDAMLVRIERMLGELGSP